MTIDYWLADAKFLFLGHRNLTAKDDFPILDKIVAFQISATSQSSVNPKGKHLYTVTRRLWFWLCRAARGVGGEGAPQGWWPEITPVLLSSSRRDNLFLQLSSASKRVQLHLRHYGSEWYVPDTCNVSDSRGSSGYRSEPPVRETAKTGWEDDSQAGCWKSSDPAFLPCWAQFIFFLNYYYFSRIEKYMFVRYIFYGFIYLFFRFISFHSFSNIDILPFLGKKRTRFKPPGSHQVKHQDIT